MTRLIKLIIRKMNLLCKKSSRVCQGQLKLKLELTVLRGSLHPWPHCWPRPSILDCTVRKALFLCAHIVAQNLSLPRWSPGEQVSFGVTNPSSMQRNILFSHENSKGGADFISSSRWMISKSWNKTRCLNPFHSKARLGLPVSSPLAAEPSPRRQARRAQSEWVFNLISRIMYPPQVQNPLWS